MVALCPVSSLLCDKCSSHSSQCLTGSSDDSACSFDSFSRRQHPIRGRRKDKRSSQQKLERGSRSKSGCINSSLTKHRFSFIACYPPENVKEEIDYSVPQQPLQVSTTMAIFTDAVMVLSGSIFPLHLYIHICTILIMCQQQVKGNGRDLQRPTSPLAVVDSKKARFLSEEARNRVQGEWLKVP